MKKYSLFAIVFLFFFSCKTPNKEKEHAPNVSEKSSLQIADTFFLKTLEKYIETNRDHSGSRFVQIFINYEQNISRYIFFRTKSLHDLKNQVAYDVFEYKGNLIILYTGLEYLTKKGKSVSKEIENYISEKDFVSGIDLNGGYVHSNFGGNVWEFQVYHSMHDSIVLREDYQGEFRWEGSPIKREENVEFVKPIIKQDP